MALKRKRSWLVVAPCTAAVAVLLWPGGSMEGRTRTIGSDRMVSFDPLPASTGEICEVPANTALNAMPAGAQQVIAGAGTASQVRTRSGNIDKKPARYIKDPNPAWSAIAVNAENDMVVMTDENLFRIVEYSRLDNTPSGAALTEPRRVIGGDQTRTEMMCGVYLDPKTLEVYVTNNDTQNWMPVFSREARGNAVPDRVLATPHQSWGIAADETRQELFLTVQGAAAVVVYRKTASNFDAPIRMLQGDATELADPHGIVLDTKNDLMIVVNHGHRRFSGRSADSTQTMMSWEEYRRVWEQAMNVRESLRSIPSRFLGGPGAGRGEAGVLGAARAGGGMFDLPSINIYARGAEGNTPPLRVIKGPRTQLNWPSHVAVHEGRGEIFVANDADDSVLVFRTSDNGDVAPTRVIKGGRTLIKNPTGVNLDVRNGELWVANMGNYTATVFPITANGDVAPLRQIRGGPAGRIGLMIGNPGAVGYDSKRQEILVPN